MKGNRALYLILVLMGAAWGLVFTLTKIAVSSGYRPFGILVWQMVIMLVASVVLLRLRRMTFGLHHRHLLLYFGVAVLGTVFPNYFSYIAAAQLPAGILVIIVALVPLFAMLIALVIGYEKPSFLRLSGIGFGAMAVAVLVGPEASLPDPEKVGYVLLAMLMPLSYGAEGNFLTWIKTRGHLQLPDPVQILLGTSLFGLAMSLPAALIGGQFITPFQPWGLPEWAILAASLLNWGAYVGYVWLIGRAGPVFAAQVAYLVTGFGVVWAMLLLEESYSPYIWAALGLMMVGLFLVQPRNNRQSMAALVPKPAMGKDAQ